MNKPTTDFGSNKISLRSSNIFSLMQMFRESSRDLLCEIAFDKLKFIFFKSTNIIITQKILWEESENKNVKIEGKKE